jgi:hypothetical protein
MKSSFLNTFCLMGLRQFLRIAIQNHPRKTRNWSANCDLELGSVSLTVKRITGG